MSSHLAATANGRATGDDKRTSARVLGLNFIALNRKPYHLVIRRKDLELPPFKALLETLGRASFRREMEACTGYDMRTAGDRLV